MPNKKSTNTNSVDSSVNSQANNQESKINLDIEYVVVLPHQLFCDKCYKNIGINLRTKKYYYGNILSILLSIITIKKDY